MYRTVYSSSDIRRAVLCALLCSNLLTYSLIHSLMNN